MAGPRIRVGIVGCGRVAQQRHLPLVNSLPETQLAAICDASADTRQKLAAQYGLRQAYADYRELVASNNLDAIMVATPTQFHAEVGIAALRAGKHVMLEKPLALSLDEVDCLEAAAAESGKLAAVAMNSRWHRLIREAREIIRSGSLGRIGLLRSIFTDEFRHAERPRPWMMQHGQAGCVLVEQAVHHFDLWQFLLDSEVVQICATMKDPGTFDERAAVTATMANGVVVSAMFSEGLKGTNELEVYGLEGRLRVSLYDFDGLDVTPRSEYPGSVRTRLRRMKQALVALPGAVQRKKAGGDWVMSYGTEWRHFLDCIRDHRRPECGLCEGRRALRVGLAAMASLARGGPVRIADVPRDIIPYGGDGRPP